MPGPGSTIYLNAASELFARLTRKYQALVNFKDAHREAIAEVDKFVQHNFETEGAISLRGKWTPLADSTIRAKLRAHNPRRYRGRDRIWQGDVEEKRANTRILQDRGLLKGRWSVFYSESAVVLQAQMPYAVFHDSDEPRRRLPQRMILPRPQQVVDVLEAIYTKHIARALERK